VMTLPDERPEPFSIVPVVVTNQGLVNALDVKLSLSANNGYRFEFLNEPSLEVLAPQQEHIFYAKLIPSNREIRVAPISGDDSKTSDCVVMVFEESHKDPCLKHKGREETRMEKRFGKCTNPSGGSSPSDGGYNPGPGSPSRGQNMKYSAKESTDNVSEPVVDCSGNTINNDPDDPIQRNIVPNNEPPAQRCDSQEEPILVYKLIPVSGERYDMRGVAADGVSKIKIVLDPEKSRLPDEDCENIFDIRWELSENLGKIEGYSLREAIYTAPDSFPSSTGSLAAVKAIVHYTQRTAPNVTWGRTASKGIEITRPPVVFIHGLGDSHKCWYKLDKYLTDNVLYEDSINYRVDYKKTNTEAFEVNVPVVGSGIYKARYQALKQGFIASKCDIVGHSMGGILARLYVQDYYGAEQVNRIITVNTPHSGSELGDAVMGHPMIFGNVARGLFSAFNKEWKSNIDAIRDLAVESKAINHLNYSLNSKTPRLPVHAIATQKNAFLTEEISDRLSILMNLGGGAAMAFGGPLGIAANVVLKYLDHFVSDDWGQIGDGDLVVSTESQLGGCTSTTIIGDGLFGDGPFHIRSPKDKKVQEKIKDLLVDPNNKSDFLTGWFFPTPRTFDHAGWQLGILGSMALDFVPPLKELKYRNKFKDVADRLGLDPYRNGNFKAGSVINKVLEKGSMVKTAYDQYLPKNENFRKANASEQNQHYLTIDLLEIEGFNKPLIVAAFGEDDVVCVESYEAKCPIPSTFSGDAKIFVYQQNEEDNIVYYEDYLYTIEHSDATPISIQADETCLSVGD
ncbi:MAG: alpha/beta fold hydrolase, partial [Muribaculaceae bacterium]|nr:alpha/beta fold hydrolase [Muribaculaceae bacterium]